MEGYPTQPRTREEIAQDIRKLHRELDNAYAFYDVIHAKDMAKKIRRARTRLAVVINDLDEFAWYREEA